MPGRGRHYRRPIASGDEDGRGLGAWGRERLADGETVPSICADPRISHRDLLTGLSGIAQRVVAERDDSQWVVALVPVNIEKPYTKKLEGVLTVMKRTPPGWNGNVPLTSEYPAKTATVVNLRLPVVSYANWFPT